MTGYCPIHGGDHAECGPGCYKAQLAFAQASDALDAYWRVYLRIREADFAGAAEEDERAVRTRRAEIIARARAGRGQAA